MHSFSEPFQCRLGPYRPELADVRTVSQTNKSRSAESEVLRTASPWNCCQPFLPVPSPVDKWIVDPGRRREPGRSLLFCQKTPPDFLNTPRTCHGRRRGVLRLKNTVKSEHRRGKARPSQTRPLVACAYEHMQCAIHNSAMSCHAGKCHKGCDERASEIGRGRLADAHLSPRIR